jgi:hypothetical protein
VSWDGAIVAAMPTNPIQERAHGRTARVFPAERRYEMKNIELLLSLAVLHLFEFQTIRITLIVDPNC